MLTGGVGVGGGKSSQWRTKLVAATQLYNQPDERDEDDDDDDYDADENDKDGNATDREGIRATCEKEIDDYVDD